MWVIEDPAVIYVKWSRYRVLHDGVGTFLNEIFRKGLYETDI